MAFRGPAGGITGTQPGGPRRGGGERARSTCVQRGGHGRAVGAAGAGACAVWPSGRGLCAPRSVVYKRRRVPCVKGQV